MSRSWTRDGVDDAAWQALTRGLTASRLWSLLLDVLGQRASQRTTTTLIEQWDRDGFVRLSSIDQRTRVALDAQLLAAAPAFEAIDLSPLAPLGACSVVGLASQNKIVSALRGTEVVSDPTNVMALECAARLRKDPAAVVRLATCHRCVRAQEVPDIPGFARHFSIFCLATAGRERQGHGFRVEALVEQIAVMLAALDRLEQDGYAFPDRRVTVLATAEYASAGDRIAAGVEGAPVTRGTLEHPYYDGLRCQITARNAAGDEPPLIDGGAFDWVGKLASNERMAYVASGFGSQLAAFSFLRRATGPSRTPSQS